MIRPAAKYIGIEEINLLDEKNIDEIISDYLTKDIDLNEKNIKASKLALLDTIGCVFNTSLNTSATIFATFG